MPERASVFYIKAPDSSHVAKHACMRRYMDIGRANRYEQVGRQAGLRISVVIAGAWNAEQSAFIKALGAGCALWRRSLQNEILSCIKSIFVERFWARKTENQLTFPGRKGKIKTSQTVHWKINSVHEAQQPDLLLLYSEISNLFSFKNLIIPHLNCNSP